jgi:pyruvate ferredoxin oxidoreductase gamma subunit
MERHLVCFARCADSNRPGSRGEDVGVLRVRFHGRGGHGIKTASRIVGTAAFLSGLQAQDFPIYGAERRGAAVAAFTRIDAQPIGERGAVADPDLILIADETLLSDPAAGVLVGRELASAVFINSSREGAFFAGQYAIPCPVLTLDLTTLTIELLGKGSALSAALGAAGCALAGLKPLDLVIRAVREELAELQLTPEMIDKNLELAGRVYASLPAALVRDRPTPSGACSMVAPTFIVGPEGLPLIHAPGSSLRRHTGSWRVFRPVIDFDACTRCGICFALCPDGAITLDGKAFPVIDYDHCKGCMMCSQECPLHCIQEQKEVRAW